MTRKETHPHGEQLSAYIDSMLDVSQMRGVGEHLHACAACRGLEADLRRTKLLVRGLPEPTLPGTDFWTAAYRQLRVDDRERREAKRSAWAILSSPEQRAHRHWAAGLAAAALIVGAFSVGPLTSTPSTVSVMPVHARVPTAFAPASSPQDVSPDVSSLAEMHTDSVSCLPLADPDQQKMIAADVQQSSEVQQSGSASEVAGDADASF